MFDQSTFGCMNFIIQQSDFTGVFKVINYRDYNGFVLQLEVYRFLKSNQYVLENIVKQNIVNPTDSKLLDRVSSEKIHSSALSYPEVKSLCGYLKQVITWANQNNHKFININILNKMSIVLTMDQLIQFYHLVDSFGKNYFILESMFTMLSKLGEPSKSEETTIPDNKITDYIPSVSPDSGENVKEYVQQQKDSKPSGDLEVLLEYCYHPNLKNLAIHYSLNYYQYVTEEDIGFEIVDNNIKIKLPNILPQSLSMDSEFFYSYIVSNNRVPLNTVTTYASKLIQKAFLDESDVYRKNPIYFMIVNLMLLVYSIRYLIELYPQIFDLQFEEILSNVGDMQKRIIQHYCVTFLKTSGIKTHENEQEYSFTFDISDFNLDDQRERKIDKSIEEISSIDSHIIPVSQEMFARSVIGKLREHTEDDSFIHHPNFRFSNKKIIDVDNLMKSIENRKKIKGSNFIDSKGTIDLSFTDDIVLTNYLHYELVGDKIITKTFGYIMNYIKQAGSVSLIEDLPKEIINLFPVITKDILTNQNLPETMDTTYEYYKVVINNLPHPESVRYITILFIVFQIVIPYYYAFYKKTIFNDCLL